MSSDSEGSTFSPPPPSPRPKQPNRSRRPFSFLRKRSISGLSIFARRTDGSSAANAGSSSVPPGSRSDSAGQRRRRPSGPLTTPPDGVSPSPGAGRDSSQATGSFTPPPTPPPSSPPHPIWFPAPSPSPQLGNTSRLLVRPAHRAGRTPVSLRPPLTGRHFDQQGYQDMILPCGLFQDQVIELMYRDLSPEDFDMLCKLDERLPKRNTLQRNLVDGLPRVLAKDCGVSECRVCLAGVEGATSLVKLPCKHAFHPACISKWLTQCKNTCPLCSSPIAEQVADGSRDGQVPRTGAGAATSAAGCERGAHRDGLGVERGEEPRSWQPVLQVRSLHL